MTANQTTDTDSPPLGRWTRKHLVLVVFMFLLPVAAYFVLEHRAFESAVDRAQTATQLCGRPIPRADIATQLPKLRTSEGTWAGAADAFRIMTCPTPLPGPNQAP